MNPVAPVSATRIASLDVIQPAVMAALVVPRTSFLPSQEFTQMPHAQRLLSTSAAALPACGAPVNHRGLSVGVAFGTRNQLSPNLSRAPSVDNDS